MIKFYSSKDDIQEYKEELNRLKSIPSPIKEILEKSDYTSYSFSVNENEERISLKDAFVLLVNIKDSSSVYFLFDNKTFNKEEAVEKISALKDIVVTDINSCKIKTSELFKIVSFYKPYFVIYQSKNGYPLFSQELLDILTATGMKDIPLFYLERELNEQVKVVEEKKESKPILKPMIAKIKGLFKKKEKKENATETTSIAVDKKDEEIIKEEVPVVEAAPIVEENKQPSEEKKESKIKEIYKNYIAIDVDNIKKNKHHFLFLSISSFLFGFASSVGFTNALIQKTISILFFVCAGVGAFLMTFIYVDYLKIKKLKDKMFVYSILFNTIGIAVAIGATMIFYSLDQSGIKGAIAVGKLIGFTIGTGYVAIIVTVALAVLIDFLQKKYGKKKK